MFRQALLLSLALGLCNCTAGDSNELFRVQLYPGNDLVLHAGSNPCTELTHYCRLLNKTGSAQGCVQEYELEVLKEILAFSDLMKLLDMKSTGLFIGCEIEDLIPASTDAPRGEFYMEMLQLLREISPDDPKQLDNFYERRNEIRMEEEEQIDIHKQAILLYPNNTFFISKLGLTLNQYGYNSLAERLWKNSVARGLWPHTMQRPELYYIPEGSTKPWYDPKDFSFTRIVEDGYTKIRAELLENIKKENMTTESASNRDCVQDNQWKLIQIKEDGKYTSASEHFPETTKILKSCDQDFILAKFSSLVPGTHIIPHTGPSNDRLRAHLGIVHSGGARIRVGDTWNSWEEGKVIIFDSSWEHEVYHDGPDTRIALILDIWST